MNRFIENIFNVQAGSFDPLLNLVKPFFTDAGTFLQSIAVMVAVGFGVYYKIREMAANQQEDQMYSQKTKAVFMGLVFVFLIPTIVSILQSYFAS